MVPNTNYLRTYLIAEVYSHQVTAYLGKTKTRKLVVDQYYWPGLPLNYNTYIGNCRTCRRTYIPRDKTLGLLHPLPISERCWQHVSFNFKSFPTDKKGFNNVFMVINQLGKRAFSLLCYKTATTANAVNLYYQYVQRVYGLLKTVTSD